ncbi:uncharacterized protein CEXT_149381 [Caerostris extrusa]|uniref:Four-helix bundle copper-binding protein n=1 Tax=Caerostris extrusa TaxID=172846 RepID=A0AAV4NK91_CAEEX|nr:uncharacterized protein CEXT_149381 [Caerostris extrusa]
MGENGGYGPLTGKACAEKCKMESMIESVGCVAQSISYPIYRDVCEDPNANPSQQIVEKCSRQCSEACREVSYILRSEVKYDQSAKCNEDLNCIAWRCSVTLVATWACGWASQLVSLVRSLGDTSLFASVPHEKQKKMG